MLALLGQRLAPALAAAGPGACRSITASRAAGDLREWLDPQTTPAESVSYGRPWMAYELRLKSWEDLHKLWYVCLKERNLVSTQMNWHKGKPAADEYKERYGKVKKTMNRIKQVLSERACQELNPIRQAQMKKAIHLM